MDHLSYSQFSTYTKCPRSWYLGKLRQAEEKQTWYIPIGSAVHDMIEAYLLGRPLEPAGGISAEQFFYPLIEKQMLIEPDLTKWLAGGPETAPVTHEKALQRAVDCFEKAVEELEAIDVWEVEYDASGRLPGLSVPIKAFIDIIGEHKTKGPVIWDWKTGSTKPDNFQLQT
ncbi:MAG TPA: PD-(D/E)XK nuclease family protein, partial [Candidatus Paceibacterota bacterium]